MFMLGIIWLVVHSYGKNKFKYLNMKDKFMFLKKINSELRKAIIKIPLVDRWLISQLLPPMLFAIGAFTALRSFKSDGMGSNIVPSLISGFVVRFGVVLLPARFEKLLPVTYL